jgi:two-component system chemotaxis sensor kinase CheA
MNDESEFLEKLRVEFLQEANDLLDGCEEVFLRFDDPVNREKQLDSIFRAVHTIKGSGAAVGLVDLVEFAHEFEDCLAVLRTYPDQLTFDLTSLLLDCLDAMRIKIRLLAEGRGEIKVVTDLIQKLKVSRSQIFKHCQTASEPSPAPFGFFTDEEPRTLEKKASPLAPSLDEGPTLKKEHPTVKVDASRIDSVLDLVGELVVLKSQLINKTENYAFDVSLAAVVSLLDKTVRELQDKALAIRMMPVKPLFLKMQRLARDLSVKMHKSIEFEMEGEDTELDRMVVESLSDPLMHLVRNAIDHGIESADERRLSGKNEAGRLHMSASQASGRIIVRLTDDGRGINRERVVQKAIEKALLPPDAKTETMSDHKIFSLLLAPGFSTSETVTDISGRGVGLDVVHNQVEKMKGRLLIESSWGQGCLFEISLLLTASVTDGMIVEIAGQMLVIPMDRIRELVKIETGAIVGLGARQHVLNVRGHMLPMVCAKCFLSRDSIQSDEDARIAVVLSHQDRLYAMGIDTVIGQMQIIMKPMNVAFPRDIIAGVTILGDGQVALIADVDGLIRSYLRSSSLAPSPAAEQVQP